MDGNTRRLDILSFCISDCDKIKRRAFEWKHKGRGNLTRDGPADEERS